MTKLDSLSSYRSLEMSMPSNRQLSSARERKHRLQPSDMFFQGLIERAGRFDTGMVEGGCAWKTIDSFIGSAVRTDEEMKYRYQLDSDLSLMVKRRQQLSSYFNADSPDHFCVFAQRMRQNIIDWQKFTKK
jgi:hypothetical protein